MNSTLEIHDSSGQVWFVNQTDIVAVNVSYRVMRIYVRNVALPIALEIHADKQQDAQRIAREIMHREYADGSRFISETAPF